MLVMWMSWGALVAFVITEIARRFSFWPGCIPIVSKNETRQTSFQDEFEVFSMQRARASPQGSAP